MSIAAMNARSRLRHPAPPSAGTAPSITTQPADQSIASGATATLTVVATGTPTLTYQWYQGASGVTTTPISGATLASYTTPALTVTTQYWVRVTNGFGSVDSVTATATVAGSTAPTITVEPTNQTIASGAAATFTVTATGTPTLTYQWYQGASGVTSSPISGATFASYTTPALTADASYWVRVSNAFGSDDSVTATATIAAAAAPVITKEPIADHMVAPGGSAMFWVEAFVGDPPLSYQWYQGASGDTSTPISGATDYVFNTPPVVADVNYWVRVSNVAGHDDSITVIARKATVLPTIATPPANTTVHYFAPASFHVVGAGSGHADDPLQYQWYAGTSGDTSSPIGAHADYPHYTSPPLTATTTNYWVRITNLAGTVNSATVVATVSGAPTITVQPVDRFIDSGQTATFTVTAAGPSLTYQWYAGVPSDTSTPISGATSASYTTPALSARAHYWVRVSNGFGSDDSRLTLAGIVPAGVLRVPAYLGCFRLPHSAAHITDFSRGSCTGRVVSGNVRLFITGQLPTYDGPIIEVQDPGTYSYDYTTSPFCTITGYWTAEYASHRGTWRGGDPTFQIIQNNALYGLHWDEGNQLLYQDYMDIYNVSGFPDWNLCAIQLGTLTAGEGTTVGYGPWRFHAQDSDGFHFYGAWRGIFIAAHPITNQIIATATLNSGNASSSFGPALFGGATWPTPSTPSGMTEPDLNLPDRWCNYYFMGGKINGDGTLIAPNPLRAFRRRMDCSIFEPFPDLSPPALAVNPKTYVDAIGPTGSWTEMDVGGGVVWIEGPTKKGIIHCGFATGAPNQNPTNPYSAHEYYGNNLNQQICTHDFSYMALFVPPRGQPATGPNTHAGFPWLCCYDPAELAAVKNTANDYTVEPKWFINLETYYATGPVRTADLGAQGGKSINGFYFNPTTRKLYAVSHQGDDTIGGNAVTLFHVWQFDAT